DRSADGKRLQVAGRTVRQGADEIAARLDRAGLEVNQSQVALEILPEGGGHAVVAPAAIHQRRRWRIDLVDGEGVIARAEVDVEVGQAAVGDARRTHAQAGQVRIR